MACKQEVLNLSITGGVIEKAVKSFALSKRYVQIMVRSSILNILYQRMVLNEGDLKVKKYKDIPFVVFKRRSVKDPLLCQYLAWVKGIAEAIDKNYLKEIFVFLKNPLNDELLESYRFYLKYNLDKDYENRRTSEDLNAATQELLQVIYDLGKYAKLNKNTNVLLELTYFDTTPESYQPPGFEDSLDKHCLVAPNFNSHLATLKTGFHRLACYGAGLVFNERSQTPEIIITEEPENEEADLGDMNINILQPNLSANEEHIQKANAHKIPFGELNVSNITVSDNGGKNLSVVSGKSGSILMTEEYFSCICELGVSIDVELISCSVCKNFYHAPCHGYLSKEDASQIIFTCVRCNTNDPMLLQINKNEWPLLARVRMVLYLMEKHNKFPTNLFKLLSETDRNMILRKVEAFNILAKRNEPGKINKLTLKQVLSRFFLMDNSQVLH